jgi:hypothetical protein
LAYILNANIHGTVNRIVFEMNPFEAMFGRRVKRGRTDTSLDHGPVEFIDGQVRLWNRRNSCLLQKIDTRP